MPVSITFNPANPPPTEIQCGKFLTLLLPPRGGLPQLAEENVESWSSPLGIYLYDLQDNFLGSYASVPAAGAGGDVDAPRKVTLRPYRFEQHGTYKLQLMSSSTSYGKSLFVTTFNVEDDETTTKSPGPTTTDSSNEELLYGPPIDANFLLEPAILITPQSKFLIELELGSLPAVAEDYAGNYLSPTTLYLYGRGEVIHGSVPVPAHVPGRQRVVRLDNPQKIDDYELRLYSGSTFLGPSFPVIIRSAPEHEDDVVGDLERAMRSNQIVDLMASHHAGSEQLKRFSSMDSKKFDALMEVIQNRLRAPPMVNTLEAGPAFDVDGGQSGKSGGGESVLSGRTGTTVELTLCKASVMDERDEADEK